MRKLFLHINVSLDGYINDPGGDIDWHFSDHEFQRYLDELLHSIDGMLFGRIAFEELAGYWPDAGDEVSAAQRDRMHELPKYVLSRSLTTTSWHNSHLLGGNLVDNITHLKQQPGRDLALFAGASATKTLLKFGVLDELRLIVNPVVLGGGTRLFDAGLAKSYWSFIDTRVFASGAVLLSYEART